MALCFINFFFTFLQLQIIKICNQTINQLLDYQLLATDPETNDYQVCPDGEDQQCSHNVEALDSRRQSKEHSIPISVPHQLCLSSSLPYIINKREKCWKTQLPLLVCVWDCLHRSVGLWPGQSSQRVVLFQGEGFDLPQGTEYRGGGLKVQGVGWGAQLASRVHRI